jgi:hypothetical protein
MGTKFNQGKPARKTPAVCFPSPPGPPPIPGTLPSTLHAAFYTAYEDNDGTLFLDIFKTTITRAPGTNTWSNENAEPEDFYVVDFEYIPSDDQIDCHYERSTLKVPDHTADWEIPRTETHFPNYVALEKVEQTAPPIFTWAYVTA